MTGLESFDPYQIPEEDLEIGRLLHYLFAKEAYENGKSVNVHRNELEDFLRNAEDGLDEAGISASSLLETGNSFETPSFGAVLEQNEYFVMGYLAIPEEEADPAYLSAREEIEDTERADQLWKEYRKEISEIA